MSEWKAVRDELPGIGMYVLCVGVSGTMFVGYTKHDKLGHEKVFFHIPGTKKGRLATHWMMLPQPPINVTN